MPLAVDNAEISPKNQDGIQDTAGFSFMSSIPSYYDFRIEEDIRMVDFRSRYMAMAGNSSKLIMLSALAIGGSAGASFKVYLRESTNLGRTWSVPRETNLTDDWIPVSLNGYEYEKLDLAYNASESSYILMAAANYHVNLGGNINLQFFKSFNGLNWTYLNYTSIIFTGTDSRYINFDMTLSGNNSEILAMATNIDSGNQNRLYFVKLRNNGKTLQATEIASGAFSSIGYMASPAIAISPAGHITCIWWQGSETKPTYYYMKSSADNGSTWSTTVQLGSSRGIGSVDTPAHQCHESRSFQMAYNQTTGLLNAVIVVNQTRVYSLTSTNGGANWTNMMPFRTYTGQAYVYSMQLVDLQDGNVTLGFVGALDGNRLGAAFQTFGTSYTIHLRAVLAVYNVSIAGSTLIAISWNGKDQVAAQYVPDGYYLARAWIKNTTYAMNPIPSEARVKVDNEKGNVSIAGSSRYFSPVASPGVKDTTDISFTSLNAGIYDLYCDGDTKLRPEIRVTNNLADDFHVDVAMDINSKLWCVYTSYQEHDRDLYLKTSDDYGVTFTLPTPFVVSSYQDDGASIAIHGDTIYIVFMRMHPTITPGAEVFDLYFMKSNNLGQTWNTPANITAAEYYPGGRCQYLSPDILVTANGTVFIAYCNTDGPVRQIEVMKSSDGGTLFSSPRIITSLESFNNARSPISLAFDEPTQTLYAATGNVTKLYGIDFVGIKLFNSTNWGVDWTLRGFHIGPSDYYVRGITLDIDRTGTMRAGVLSSNFGSLTMYISTNTGATWSYEWDYPLNSAAPADTESPLFFCNVRSGRSPRGDIFYTFERTPVTDPNRDVYVTAFTSTEQHHRGVIQASSTKVVNWNGMNLWDLQCSNDDYNVSIVVTDTARNTAIASTTSTIDNGLPNVMPVITISELSRMDPEHVERFAVLILNTSVDFTVDLYYRFSNIDPYTILGMVNNGTHFYQDIPTSLSTLEVEFYINATDHAGNTQYFMPWFYFKPQPVVVTNWNTNAARDRLLDLDYEVIARGLPTAGIDSVYINYKFDGAASFTLETMQNIGNVYNFSFAGNRKHTSFEFQILVLKSGMTEPEAVYTSETIRQDYVPEFPSAQIEYPWNIIVAVVSAVVGIAFAAMQVHGKRTSVKKIQDRFYHMLRTYAAKDMDSMKDRKDLAKLEKRTRGAKEGTDDETALARSRLMYNVTLVGTLGTIAGGAIAALAFHSGGTGMLVSALGMFLSTFCLMERVIIDASNAIYIDKKYHFLTAIFHVILVGAVLAIFMISAPLVGWFNYYIFKDTFSIGSVTIPRLWLSLITPMITSVLLILITGYLDLKNSLKRFETMRQKRENWKLIWQQKEEVVSKLNTNMALKMIVFLITIAFAVISTTQIGQFALAGMLVLLPFVLSWLVVVLISMFLSPVKPTVKDALKSWLIEKTKKCQTCGTINLFESIYCTQCKAAFAGETSIIEQTKECAQCKERSPEPAMYCRTCGTEFGIKAAKKSST